MTLTATARTVSPRWAADEAVHLADLIDWRGLERRGWDPSQQVFAPDADDPVFGFAECRVVACNEVGRGRTGLCWRCRRRWAERAGSPGANFEEFCEIAPLGAAEKGGLCRVCCTPGHERPARTHGLCRSCTSVMGQRGQTIAAYLGGDDEFPPALPRPSFGRCNVVACDRLAEGRSPRLCESHRMSWSRAGRPLGAAIATWCARQRPIDPSSRVVVLRGLAESVQMEVLYGLQCRARVEQRTGITSLRCTANFLRRVAAPSILGLSIDHLDQNARVFLAFVRDWVSIALASPGTEIAKEDWDLRVFGRSGRRLHFGRISQPWLKEAAKCWASERLDAAGTSSLVIEQVLRSLGRLSESLRRHRGDRGVDSGVLSRADLTTFANDLAHLESSNAMSRYMRRMSLRHIGLFLREARGMGLTMAGRPLAGLPEDVSLRRSDMVRDLPADDEGRALPAVIMDRLLDPAALELLEATADGDVRAMVELQARVGRRTAELCGLRWNCLRFDEVLDESGDMRPAPVMVLDMPKVAIRGYHLPIDRDAAEIIQAQQTRARDRHPDTPVAQLALFPALARNPRGVRARSTVTFRERFRVWVDRLPVLVGVDGKPYDRSTVTPYSFRHTYAQRHADGGTPVEVLAALMGHRKLTTTQGYYRVHQDRKRKAVDLLAALQVDRSGDRTRPSVERLLEAEAARDAIGQVAVPFGICREPTNVKADGQSCPFRHQCFGCTHFHSDPSFLPELRAYLSRLLADRERLRAARPELEDWARNAAIPSAEEIAAVRRIIDRCEQALADLPDDTRGEIEEAIGVLRRSRAQLDTAVPVRFLGVIGQPSPTLFPNLQRPSAEKSRP